MFTKMVQEILADSIGYLGTQTFAVGSENFSSVNVFRVLVLLIPAANSNYAELLRKNGLGEAGRIL